MRDLLPYLKLLRGGLVRSLLLGLVLVCIAGGAAVSLVGLSGWFITMSALVGFLGITTFSYLFPSGGIRAFALLRTLARYSERVVNHQATFLWLARLRILFFKKAISLPGQRFASFRSGDLLSRAMADIDALDQVLLRVLIPTIATGVVVLAGLAFLGIQSVLLAILVLPLMLLAGVGLPLFMAWRNRHPGSHFIDVRARLRTRCIEALQGRWEIVAYHAEGIVKHQFLQEMGQLEQVQRILRRRSATSGAVTLCLVSITVLVALSVGLPLVTRRVMPAPVLVMICLLIMGIFESIETLPLAYQFFGVVQKAAQRLNMLFLEEESARDEQHLSPPFPTGQTLTMRDISFRYSGQERHVLHRFDCTLPPAALIAVTGPSGSGKSTLLKLLAREIEQESGSIEMGETPMSAFTQDVFQSHVAFVSQDSHIFNATLQENLLMAKPEATTQEMHDVLAAVCLTDLLKQLEHGLDTRLGEQGYTLSGGERRRLSIAQALLRAPSLLLLDEPTAGVDRTTAERMMVSLRALLPTSTIVVATHDPCLLSSQALLKKPDSEIQLALLQIDRRYDDATLEREVHHEN